MFATLQVLYTLTYLNINTTRKNMVTATIEDFLFMKNKNKNQDEINKIKKKKM